MHLDLPQAATTVSISIIPPGKVFLAFEEADPEPEAPSLTRRELDIVTAFARGQGNKQIARDLAISEKTVRNHVSNIYKKLHVYDSTQTVPCAIRGDL